MRLSFFTVPKDRPTGHVRLIQRNAILAVLNLAPDIELTVFGEPEHVGVEPGTRLVFIRDFMRSDSGVPVLDSVFDAAQRHAQADIVCYFNCDIVFTSGILDAADRLRGQDRFLAVGERCDLEVATPIDFESRWQEQLREKARRSGVPHGPAGIDYFLFPRGQLVGLPPFRVGRPVWDNWLLYHAKSSGLRLIDATPVVLAIHQQHDYSHVAGGIEEARTGADAEVNRRLAGSAPRLVVHDAEFVLTPRGVRRALAPRYLRRRLDGASAGLAELTMPRRIGLRVLLWAMQQRERLLRPLWRGEG